MAKGNFAGVTALGKWFDVVVIGGGLAGVGCALEVAACGKQVLLVERRSALGWESTRAGQLDFGGRRSTVAQRVIDEIDRVGGLKGDTVDGPILEIALDRMVERAGISLLLYSFPVRLVSDGGAASGVVVGSRSGETVVRGRAIVDATEEAILWRQTGIHAMASEGVSGKCSFFMNHVEGDLELPLDIGNGVQIWPSVWDGEVRVEYDVADATPLAARSALPDSIRRARDVPQLADALVSHVLGEAFPLDPFIRFERPGIINPSLCNLYGCGIWATDAENNPAGRLALGERIALAIDERGTSGAKLDMMRTGSVSSRPGIVSDILVIGGGTAGAIAAIVAGRSGLRTTLIETQLALGGVGTTGSIHSYYYGLGGGVQEEVETRMAHLSPLFCGKWEVQGFHPEVKKQVLYEMAREAEVDIRLDTVVVGVRLEGGKTRTAPEPSAQVVPKEREMRNELMGVLAVSPTGISEHEAKVFIDCTGDGDVAAMAGAPFIVGRERDNVCHTYSQVASRLDGATGALHSLNFDAGYVDPMDVVDSTRARRYGIQLYWQEPFTEETRILNIAPLLGVRQGRQIVGEYQLTLADEILGSRFDDAVSFTEAHYDNHADDYENESDQATLWVWALANWKKTIGCEVPYRCLLPKCVDGLLIASRALSVTYDAHASLRMQKDIQRIGEVAALAAVQAINEGVGPRDINIEKLKSMLRASGILDERYRPKPALPERQVAQIHDVTSIDSDRAKEIVWLAVHGGGAHVASLRRALTSPEPDVHFKASAALATLGFDEGVSMLIQRVENRTMEVPDGHHTAPLWQAAIPFLGVAANPKAVPTLIGVLRDPEAPLDALIAAVRSLGRIGEASAIEQLRDLLLRPDLPHRREFRTVMGVRGAIEDARWQLELATAEALGRLGAPASEVKDIVQPYLEEDRAYVRRYARRVLREAGVADPN